MIKYSLQSGFKISDSKINTILESLDIKIISKSKNELNIEVPNYRHDVTREIDVIEEIHSEFMDITIFHHYLILKPIILKKILNHTNPLRI